jgi:hypothetical protein
VDVQSVRAWEGLFCFYGNSFFFCQFQRRGDKNLHFVLYSFWACYKFDLREEKVNFVSYLNRKILFGIVKTLFFDPLQIAIFNINIAHLLK